jgi:hypothetical protein
MMKLVCVWAVLMAFACSDDEPTVAAGAFGATCTTVTDTGSTECDSGVCSDSFDQLGHPACSLKCTPGDGSTCPEGSEGKKCNGKGYCKP